MLMRLMGFFMQISRQEAAQALLDGAEARRKGKSKQSVPDYDGSFHLRHKWLAGWNDEDIGML